MRDQKGLTVIELLAVILIIGLLSTIGAVALKGAREKARDANRISDMRQIVNALELFFSKYAYYPGLDPDTGVPTDQCGAVTCTCGGAGGPASGIIGNTQAGCIDIDQALAEFFAQPPIDPLLPAGGLDNVSPPPSEYFYYYLPAYTCTSTGQPNPTIFIMNTETNKAEYNLNPCTESDAGNPDLADYLQVFYTR